MFDDLKILAKAGMMARHAVERQRLIAENVANANTPGFKAKDLQPFEQIFANNINITDTTFRSEQVFRPGGAEPNGNTVSIENEILASAESAAQHETAMLIYRKSLDILRLSVRGR